MKAPPFVLVVPRYILIILPSGAVKVFARSNEVGQLGMGVVGTNDQAHLDQLSHARSQPAHSDPLPLGCRRRIRPCIGPPALAAGFRGGSDDDGGESVSRKRFSS